MKKNDLLWNFNDKYIPSVFPEYARCQDIYYGKYSSAKYSTACLPSNSIKNRSGMITPSFMKALLRAKQIANGCDKNGFGSNGKHSIAEYTDSDMFEGATVGKGNLYSIVYDRISGKIIGNVNGKSIKNIDVDRSFIFLALWGAMLEDSVFDSFFKEFCRLPDENLSDDEKDMALSHACYMADYFYMKTTTNSSPSSQSPDKLLIENDVNQIGSLSQTRINALDAKDFVLTGNFENFFSGKKVGKRAKDKKSVDVKSFFASYKFTDREFSDEEKALIPTLSDNFVITDDIIDICNLIKVSSDTPRPIRNILLRGAPGTGKTEIYKAVAYGLGLPLYSFAANYSTEAYDILGQFVPVEGGPINIPSAEDIEMDPVIAYKQITGIDRPGVTEEDCYEAIKELKRQDNGQPKFKFAMGQMIHALKHGGVFGIDEVNLPANAGVIPVLNPAMDGTQAITLTTGEIIKRHPDCIFIATANIGLEGCNPINTAWQDRCQIIIDMPTPPDEEVKAKVISMTGYTKEKYPDIDIDKMIVAFNAIREICQNKQLVDGEVGIRKLADWITSTMVFGDVIKAAKKTIITGATTDPEGKEAILSKLEDLFV